MKTAIESNEHKQVIEIMHTVCMRCNVVIIKGLQMEPVSHGVCKRCKSLILNEFRAFKAKQAESQ